MAKEIDWLNIKNDYINTQTSYRKLCDKYGVSFATLRCRAEKEKWTAQKTAQQHRIAKEVAQKTAQKIVAAEVDRFSRLLELTDKATSMTEKAIEQLESILTGTDIVKTGFVDTYKLRQITASIKDIKEVQAALQETGKRAEVTIVDDVK